MHLWESGQHGVELNGLENHSCVGSYMSLNYWHYTKCSKTECSPRVCLGEWLTAPLALLCLCQCYSRAIGEKLFNVT